MITYSTNWMGPANMKWAVMVAFEEGDWMYVTERTDDYGNLSPVLFDTHQAAEDFASIYKHHKIVEYTNES